MQLLPFIYLFLFSQDNRDAMVWNFDLAWGKNYQVVSEVVVYYQMLPAHDDFSLRLCPHEGGVSTDGEDNKK